MKSIREWVISLIETVLEASPTLKDCVAEAQKRINDNNPFHGVDHPKYSGMSNPCNEIPLGETHASAIDKDYGKLKTPAKKHFIN